MVTKGRNLKRLKVVRESHPQSNNQVVGEQSVRPQVQRESQPQINNEAVGEQQTSNSVEGTNEDGFTTYVDNNGRRFKRRGPTVLADLWNMDPNERIDVQVDKHGVPCGPESGLFASFLGVVARNGFFTPLELNWRKAEFRPYKAKILDLVQTKFRYPPATTKWILTNVNRRWSDHKTKLKSLYYDPELSAEEVLAKPKPADVIDTHWHTLVNRWYTEDFQRLSQINAEKC